MRNFLKEGKASVLIDGQFGSTGKGLCMAVMEDVFIQDADDRNVVCVTNAAPNAGHTTVFSDGSKIVTFHMPTLGAITANSGIYLNAGAIIDIDVLKKEIDDLGIDPSRITIHPHAAVITQEDKDYEASKSSGTTKIASTQKGVGRALARKIMREGYTAKDFSDKFNDMDIHVDKVDLAELMEYGYKVMIEVPQGMSLSVNNGFHPYCTSREVSVSQALSDAGIHPSYLHKTVMTIRTFPIRVGNITDENGVEIGNSGPAYPDQLELSWDDFPNVEPERTTVTKRVRRIFTFSYDQYMESLVRLRPDYVHVGFCDYLQSKEEFDTFVRRLDAAEMHVGVKPIRYYAFGPSRNDCVFSEEKARLKYAK